MPRYEHIALGIFPRVLVCADGHKLDWLVVLLIDDLGPPYLCFFNLYPADAIAISKTIRRRTRQVESISNIALQCAMAPSSTNKCQSPWKYRRSSCMKK